MKDISLKVWSFIKFLGAALALIFSGMYIHHWYVVCMPIILKHSPKLIADEPGAFKGYILSSIVGGAIVYYRLKIKPRFKKDEEN